MLFGPEAAARHAARTRAAASAAAARTAGFGCAARRSARGRARTRPGGRSRGARRRRARREATRGRRVSEERLPTRLLPKPLRRALPLRRSRRRSGSARAAAVPGIARESAAQTLEQLGVRVGVRGPGRPPDPRARRSGVCPGGTATIAPRPCAHASSAPESSAAPDRGAAFVRAARGAHALLPPPPPRESPAARGDGADEARDDPGEEKRPSRPARRERRFRRARSAPQRPRSNVPFPFAPSLASCDARPNSTETQYPNPGSRFGPGEAGDVARVVEGADDRSQRRRRRRA